LDLQSCIEYAFGIMIGTWMPSVSLFPVEPRS